MLSISAAVASTEKIRSALLSQEEIPSFSNRTSTWMLFSSWTYRCVSNTFLEKREIDLQRMISISPLRAASIILMNSGRLVADVPVIPLSAYMPEYSQSGFFRMKAS